MGAGYGHVGPFSQVARCFLRDGWRVVLLVKDLSRVSAFFEPGEVEVLQAPVKNSHPVHFVKDPPTYGHILLNMGYQDTEELGTLIEAWRNLLTLLQPDLLIFDHSPSAIIAARGMTIPQVTFGSGFFSPPPERPLPLMADWRPLSDRQRVDDEDKIVDTINMVLSRWAGPSLTGLADLFEDLNGNVLATWPEMDHYGERCGEEYFGTWSVPSRFHDCGINECWRGGKRKKLFAYLKSTSDVSTLLAIIGRCPVDALVVVDNADVGSLKKVTPSNVLLLGKRVPMQPVLAQCEIAILNGNHGTLGEFLLAGIPLLLLPLTFEQAILSKRLESIKAIATARLDRPDIVEHQLKAIIHRPEVLTGSQRLRQLYGSETDVDRIERSYSELIRY